MPCDLQCGWKQTLWLVFVILLAFSWICHFVAVAITDACWKEVGKGVTSQHSFQQFPEVKFSCMQQESRQNSTAIRNTGLNTLLEGFLRDRRNKPMLSSPPYINCSIHAGPPDKLAARILRAQACRLSFFRYCSPSSTPLPLPEQNFTCRVPRFTIRSPGLPAAPGRCHGMPEIFLQYSRAAGRLLHRWPDCLACFPHSDVLRTAAP